MPSASSIPQWLVLLRPPRETFPADATPAETETVKAHFAHLAMLCERGVVILAGRTQEDQNPIGVVVLRAEDRATAERIMKSDPVISSGLFSMEMRPYEVAVMSEG